MICKGNCWERFTTTCQAQGHQLFWASGASLQTVLLKAASGVQGTASGLGMDFRQQPVPCCTAPPSSAQAHMASSDSHTDTRLLLASSHKLWEQAGAEHPLPTTSSSSCDANPREYRALPGLSSLQQGPASPPWPESSSSSFSGVRQWEKLVRTTDGCSCSTELLLQLLSTLVCQTPKTGQTTQGSLPQQREAASVHSEQATAEPPNTTSLPCSA